MYYNLSFMKGQYMKEIKNITENDQCTNNTFGEKLRSFLLREGINETPVPWLNLYSFTSEKIDMPQTDNLYLYLVADGSVRLYTPSGIMDYISGQYSISEIDTPLCGHVLTFSSEKDFLAMSVEFAVNDVVSVVLQLNDALTESILKDAINNEEKSRSDERVTASAQRLLSVFEEPDQAEFMADHIRREIIFHVLCGSCGRQFLTSVINISRAGDIYEINSWIKKNFRNSFTVEELAERKNMSVSLFHQKFKSAVGMGPLQCQKRLRLTEARRLMLDENRNATEAALEVGYESASQFTREYKKMFGASPKEDVENLRRQLKM